MTGQDDPQPVTPPVAVTRAGSETARLSIELAQLVQGLVRVVEDQPAIPASEVCAALRYLASLEYGLARAYGHLAACVSASSDAGLFWAAQTPEESTRAAAALGWASRRLTRAGECAADVGTLLSDAREDIAFEGSAVTQRLLERRPIRWEAAITAEVGTAAQPTATDAETDKWLTAAEAATVLGIGVTTLKTTWVSRRQGPIRYRVNGQFAYRRSEVLAIRDRRAAKRSAA